MAKISWVKIQDRMIDMERMEHVALIKGDKPMMTFDSYDGHHYVISFKTNGDAEDMFNGIWKLL